jgi:outer membrane biosynthesis protein TonB
MALDYPEEHRREALGITAAVVLLLALVCFFLKFSGPNPPLTALGGDGVELNYGLDEAGSGDIQTMATANASTNREDSRPPAAQPDPTPQPAQPRVEATPAPQPEVQEKVITSEAEDAEVAAPPVEKPAVKPVRPVEPVRETPVPPKPREQPRALYTPKGSASGAAGGNGVAGTSSAPTGNSNGDRPGTVGDQGDRNGSLDAKALYGAPGSGGSGSRPGSGGGGGLEMSGWRFDSTPVVEALDDNPGVVRFKIIISSDGEVESVTKVSGNVSPAQEKLCRDKLLDANFVKTNAGAGGATGFYTFRFSVR